MNLIDMAAIVPYYIDVGVNVYIKNSSNLDIGACPRSVVELSFILMND